MRVIIVKDAQQAGRVAADLVVQDMKKRAVYVLGLATGSTPIPRSEMQHGRNFQIMLYLLVAQYLLEHDSNPDRPRTVAGGTFWHLNTRKLSGDVRLADEDDADALNAAQEHLGRYIRLGRQGYFTVHPNKGDGSCALHCDFSQMCRRGAINRFKHEG